MPWTDLILSLPDEYQIVKLQTKDAMKLKNKSDSVKLGY